jgi:hypothetical protein
MGLFEGIGKTVQSGLSWGKAAVSRWGDKAARAGNTMVVDAARMGTQWATSDPKRLEDLRKKLDKRDRYTSKAVQLCGNPNSKHPNKQDGQYIGGDCHGADCKPCRGKKCPGSHTGTHATKPAQGVRPAGCECGKDGKPFPKITFTNGISNDAGTVCCTIKALANSRCAEVIGVYNATYADKSVASPDFRAADYKDAAKSGAWGALKGAAEGLLEGGVGGLAGGAAAGAAKGAAPDLAMDGASRTGMVQDVMDCVDAILKCGDEAASKTLANEIVSALNGSPPAMTIYAHSQGGLNTSAAIAQAKREIKAGELKRLIDMGTPDAIAERQAEAMATERLSGLEVHTFGTLERGLPDGPQYHRYRNEYDPVPVVIEEAQKSLVPDDVKTDPKGAAQVEKISKAFANPMDAHGMQEAYIPHLNEKHGKGDCC